jgi:curved DNA-binding protein CbpA
MAESFYGVLGVGPDADTEKIERSYRRLAKQYHPDVSEAADATEEFKRITAARATLVDHEQRRRYDTLGHEAYLEATGGCPGWPNPEETHGTKSSTDRKNPVENPVAGPDREDGQEPSVDPEGPSGTPRGHQRTRPRTDGGTASRGSGFIDGSFWDAETQSGTRGATAGRGRSLWGVTNRIGAWVLLDVVLLGLAIGMAWFVYAILVGGGVPSPPVFGLLVFDVGIAVLLVIMHAASKLSR